MNSSLGKIKTRLFLSVHGQSWECSDGDIIGREGTVALEVFRGAGVLSRRHITVRFLAEEWFVELCPTARNLTWINEDEMLPGQMYPLGLQSVITVEDVQFTLLIQQADHYLNQDLVSSWALPSVRSFSVYEDGLPRFQPAEADPKQTGGTLGILNQMPGCVMVFDEEGYCIWSNATAAGMLGTDEPPATIASFCLSFHREDEMFLKDCLGNLEESIPKNATGLRVVDPSTGSVIGNRTLWLLQQGGQTIISAEAEPDAEQALIGLRLLGATYLCPDFHDSDVTVRFEAIARSGLKILRCDEVSIWLIDPKDSLAKRATTVSIDDRSIEQGNKIQPGFCPLYFNRLLEAPHAAFEGAEGSVMPVLKGLGFTGRATGAILSVPLFQGSGLRGIVAFEWDLWKGKLSEDARLSALLVASLCLSAAASTSHHAALKQLRMREVQMAKELADAEHYVRQVLPPPLDGEIDVRWMLKPSAQLGGDAFGYYWIDEDRFAIYLLDVVGHGTGAALLSISAMNSVRAQILPDVDFGNPAAVLAGLNRAFQMETQNDMTFTIWYGIYQRSSRQLFYASAGHPPALLLDPKRANQCVELSTDGLIIGHMDDFEYENAVVAVPPGAKLYVLSDGAFEIERPDGAPWPYEQFVAAVRSTGSMEDGEVEYLYERTQQVIEGGELQDDFTMLRVRFPE